MSTSDTPIPRTATTDEAMAVLSDDPVAYNLPADATEDQVKAAKETAAANLVAGSAANAAYWNSRSELEQFVARAQGHGQLVAPATDEADSPTPGVGPTVSGGDVEGTVTPAAALPVTEAEGEQPAPNDGSPEDRLRAQLRAANIEPEA